MANVDADLLDDVIKITHGDYEDIVRIRDSKQVIASERDIKYMLCDLLDVIDDLQYENKELKNKLNITDEDEYLNHLGDIADEEYEKKVLGL
jgi:hypothetical protein